MIPGLFGGQSRYRQPDYLSVLNTLLTISLALKMLFTLKATPFIEPIEIKCIIPCFRNSFVRLVYKSSVYPRDGKNNFLFFLNILRDTYF